MKTESQTPDALERHALARKAYEEARAPAHELHTRLETLKTRHREAQATSKASRESWRDTLEASAGEATEKAKEYLTRAREAEELTAELLRMIQHAEQQLRVAQVAAADARKNYVAAHAKAEAQQQAEALKEAVARLQGADAARDFAKAAAPTWARIPAQVQKRPIYAGGAASALVGTADLREQYQRDVRAARLETLFGGLLDQVAAAAAEGAGKVLEIERLPMLPGESDDPDVVSVIARHARRHAA
ncbi:MAG: hypothetical protein ABR558_06800 [Thioalkalivibrio sp.]